jgi:hypothetical protein
MKQIILILITLIQVFVGISQQKLGSVWVSGIDGQQIIFKNNVITTKKGVHINNYFTGGNSNISDSNGNLLLVSDGYNIYDSTSTFIDGGDTLIPKDFYIDQHGSSFSSQSSIFLPMDSGIYYFITPTESNPRFAECTAGINCYFDLMLYNVIDMKANNGAGKVVKRMIPILENANMRKTQMMACRHGNGKDWWLLKQEGDSANVHTFLFTQDSVYDKGVQVFDNAIWGKYDLRGMSTFNIVGNQYASTSVGGNTGLVFLADFDRCYGTLNNPYTIEMPLTSTHNPNDTAQKEHSPVGIIYSPNGQFLYVVSMYNVYQYDLQDNTWLHVAGLDTTWQQFQEYNASYLAPNGKIYIGNRHGLSKQMSVIDNPDVKGAGCNFCPRCLRTDSLFYGYLGTPPCMPNYGLGARVCYPENTEQLAVSSEQLAVYPNPSSTIFYIKNKKGKKKELYNSVGELVLSTTKEEINVSHFSIGVYYMDLRYFWNDLLVKNTNKGEKSVFSK